MLESIHSPINVWNKLSTGCVHASSVDVFNNRLDKYLVRADYTYNNGRVTLE